MMKSNVDVIGTEEEQNEFKETLYFNDILLIIASIIFWIVFVGLISLFVLGLFYLFSILIGIIIHAIIPPSSAICNLNHPNMIWGGCFGFGVLIEISVIILTIMGILTIYLVSKYCLKLCCGIEVKCNPFRSEFLENMDV